jgi:hypothetical protein
VFVGRIICDDELAGQAGADGRFEQLVDFDLVRSQEHGPDESPYGSFES